MNTVQIINYMLFSGMLGAIGQGIRVIVGIKKTYDTSHSNGQSFKDNFQGSQMFISLIIGFIAGCLGGLAMLDTKVPTDWDKKGIIELIAIGYAGADFIEGFVKKYLPDDAGGTNTPSASLPTGNGEEQPVG